MDHWCKQEPPKREAHNMYLETKKAQEKNEIPRKKSGSIMFPNLCLFINTMGRLEMHTTRRIRKK